ncbi:MAG: inositol monophosphatase [Candidatus Firestonebacteria bacterium]|nr:inositol monophosphatase [Candidatus Firestonebacteria bacterium]
MWDTLAEVLKNTVLRAGHMLRSRFENVHTVEYKTPVDVVTEMDRAVEALFIRTIRRRFPTHEILAEETVEGSGGNPWARLPERGAVRWIIDPLDGTTNYAHRVPHCAVSAALVYRGVIRLGAVYHPWRRELYFACRGKGAWNNETRARVSETKQLKQALLVTAGFPHEKRIGRNLPMAPFRALAHACQAIRRTGSAALDLADVACGRYDGFWDLLIKPWDVAAGALLIGEAGGRITNFNGRGPDLYAGDFIASNGRLHASLSQYLSDWAPGRLKPRGVGRRH